MNNDEVDKMDLVNKDKDDPESNSGDVEINKMAILEAAIKAFAKYGYDGVSLRQIAKAVGINHQNITHYFGNKEDLWAAALRKQLEFFEPLDDHLKFTGDLENQKQIFRKSMYENVKITYEHSAIFAIYCQEGMQNGPRYRKLLEEYIASHNEAAKKFLLRAQQAGVIKNIPIDELMFTFKGALIYRFLVPAEFEFLTGKKCGDVEALKAHADALAELFIA